MSHHDPNWKIGQRFVWVMVVRCGGMITAQAPYEREQPTMRKGLLLRRVGQDCRFHVCSRNAIGAVDPTTATTDH